MKENSVEFKKRIGYIQSIIQKSDKYDNDEDFLRFLSAFYLTIDQSNSQFQKDKQRHKELEQFLIEVNDKIQKQQIRIEKLREYSEKLRIKKLKKQNEKIAHREQRILEARKVLKIFEEKTLIENKRNYEMKIKKAQRDKDHYDKELMDKRLISEEIEKELSSKQMINSRMESDIQKLEETISEHELSHNDSIEYLKKQNGLSKLHSHSLRENIKRERSEIHELDSLLSRFYNLLNIANSTREIYERISSP